MPIIYSCVYIEETPKMSHKEDSTFKRMSQYGNGRMPYIDGPSHVYVNEAGLWKFTIYGMCGSRKYSNVQPRMVIWFAHPFPPRIFSLALYFSSKFGYWDPHPPPLMTILGGGMDMFWTHTICSNIKMFLHTGVGFLISCTVFLLSTVVFSHFSSKSKFKNGFGIHDKDSPWHGCLKKNFIDYW